MAQILVFAGTGAVCRRTPAGAVKRKIIFRKPITRLACLPPLPAGLPAGQHPLVDTLALLGTMAGLITLFLGLSV